MEGISIRELCNCLVLYLCAKSSAQFVNCVGKYQNDKGTFCVGRRRLCEENVVVLRLSCCNKKIDLSIFYFDNSWKS